MSQTRGCLGVLRVGPTSGATGLIGEIVDWSFEESAERIDASSMGSCTKAYISGAVETTGTVTVHWDPADVGQADFAVGSRVALELYPAGGVSTTGNTYYKGVVNIDSVSRSADLDGIVESVFGWSVVGALTATVV